MRMLSALAMLALLSLAANGAPDEACGHVSRVVDGDTFDLIVDRGDSRIDSAVVRVRLADVDAPEVDCEEGKAAKELATILLLDRSVCLDIDDLNVRDKYGRLICLAYLRGRDGQILTPCVNRMIVDSGSAAIKDYKDNEFDPDKWWSAADSPLNDALGGVGGEVEGVLRRMIVDILNELQRWLNQVLEDLRDWIAPSST